MVRAYRLVASVERQQPEDVAHATMSGSTKDRLVAKQEPGRPEGSKAGVREKRLGLRKQDEDVEYQSDLEKAFANFFGQLVKEWNPCYTDDGQWRYRCDEEI